MDRHAWPNYVSRRWELPGEVIRLFVPEYDRVDQKKDRRLHSLAKIIAETMSVHASGDGSAGTYGVGFRGRLL